ncbi:MAG TPA: hypothetical protein PLH12_07890, partial [Pseudomonadales bacterium]|nr:hypothetical protein [Pseudomonadales bacterium]
MASYKARHNALFWRAVKTTRLVFMSLNTRILLGTVIGVLLGWLFSQLGLATPVSHYGLLALGIVSTVF